MRTVLSRVLVLASVLLAGARAAPEAAAAPPAGPARIFVANAPAGSVVGYDANGVEIRRVPTRFGDGAGDAFALGDVDGNGTDDPLVADAQSGNVLVHLREGLIGIAEGLGFDADGGAADALAAGDVDGDGADEIIIANAPSGLVVAVRPNGDEVAVVENTGFDSDGGDGADRFAVGDVDGNGTDELVVANAPSGEIVAYDRTGGEIAHVLQSGFDSDPGTGRDGFAVGDVTGDGAEELLVANAPGGDVNAFARAGGAPVKTFVAGFDADPGAEDRIAAGDVNADGVGDLVVASAPSEEVTTYFGTGGVQAFPDSGFDSQSGSPDGFAVGTETARDLDGDTIPDRVERLGVRAAAGTLLLAPSNPCRETINVEIDYMTAGGSFVPAQKGIDDVAAAFARAPWPGSVHCPYPDTQSLAGIELRVKVDEDLDSIGPVGTDASFDAIKAAEFRPELAPYVHYNPWVEQVVDKLTGDPVGGRCCYGVANKDFIAESQGDELEQGTTFMHELGHALRLGHGGNDEINQKPNYHSIMSYWYSHLALRDENVVDGAEDPLPEYDFSRTTLPPLDETTLSELAGIDADKAYQSHFYDAAGTDVTVRADGPVDWNGDDPPPATPDDLGVQLNVNRDDNGYCIGGGDNGKIDTAKEDDDVPEGDYLIRAGPDFVCDTTATGDDAPLAAKGTAPKITGHTDWPAIHFGGNGRGGGVLFDVPEVTKAQAEQMVQDWDHAQHPDRSVLLAPVRPGFDGVVRGVTVDGNRLFATHHYQTTATPSTSDRPGSLVVLNRATLQVVARVPVGFTPHAVAVNPVTKRVYVLSGTDPADATKSRITVIDRTSLAVLAKVDFFTAQATHDIVVNPRTNRVYVSNTAAGRIHVFNGSTNQELAPILIGPGPLGMAVDQGTNTIYVAQSRRGVSPEVAALGSVADDGVTRVIKPAVTLGPPLTQPVDVAVEPEAGRVYVASLGGSDVQPSMSALDSRTRAILGTVPLAAPSRAITVNPYGHWVFIASEGASATVDTDRLEVIRTATPGVAFSVAAEPGPSRQLYYGDLRNGTLTRLSYSSGTAR